MTRTLKQINSHELGKLLLANKKLPVVVSVVGKPGHIVTGIAIIGGNIQITAMPNPIGESDGR